jgi:hypothetical protein
MLKNVQAWSGKLHFHKPCRNVELAGCVCGVEVTECGSMQSGKCPGAIESNIVETSGLRQGQQGPIQIGHVVSRHLCADKEWGRTCLQ